MRKDIIKSLIAIKQSEIPFDVIDRDTKLPLARKKIITVPGVRRCGKSTMMEIAINELVAGGVPSKNILWLGFDDERLIQLIKDWEYFVLRLYKSYCKNIYVCGSNATMLSKELSSALRGYPLEYETFPLSFNEYCRFIGVRTDSYLEQDIARLRNAFLEYNGVSSFPEIVLTHTRSEQIKLLHGYFDTMILKDMVEHYKISNIGMVRYFVKRIMSNLTKPTSINAIYKDIKSQGLKVTKADLYLWADYACDIFLFIRIPKY